MGARPDLADGESGSFRDPHTQGDERDRLVVLVEDSIEQRGQEHYPNARYQQFNQDALPGLSQVLRHPVQNFGGGAGPKTQSSAESAPGSDNEEGCPPRNLASRLSGFIRAFPSLG